MKCNLLYAVETNSSRLYNITFFIPLSSLMTEIKIVIIYLHMNYDTYIVVCEAYHQWVWNLPSLYSMHKTWNGIKVEKFIPARTSSYCSSVIAPCLCVVKVPFMGSLLIRKIKLVRLPSFNDRHSHKFRIILLLQILQEGDFIYEKAFASSCT